MSPKSTYRLKRRRERHDNMWGRDNVVARRSKARRYVVYIESTIEKQTLIYIVEELEGLAVIRLCRHDLSALH